VLFDLKPKDEAAELFGREAELARMVELLKGGMKQNYGGCSLCRRSI